jgi:hypothetical protein
MLKLEVERFPARNLGLGSAVLVVSDLTHFDFALILFDC